PPSTHALSLHDALPISVHSMKDVPAELAPGLAIVAVSSRETPWDALCAREPVTVDTLPRGAKIGTSSMRRQCQLLARRPDLQIGDRKSTRLNSSHVKIS